MASGNVLVADTGNGRIEKFSPTGAFLSIIGTKGNGQGQFAQPNGIAIDRVGNIYVADAGNHRVLKLKLRRNIYRRMERARARILRAAPYRYRPG